MIKVYKQQSSIVFKKKVPVLVGKDHDWIAQRISISMFRYNNGQCVLMLM